jgi:hypothetical protein
MAMPVVGIIASSDGKQPDTPTIGTATGGNASATVAFTASVYKGKNNTISTYTATSSPGSITGSSATSPITVSGLTNGTAYTFTVTATANYGTGVNVLSLASAASNSVTPAGAPVSGKRCTSVQVSVGCCTSTSICAPADLGLGATCSPVDPGGWTYDC